MPSGGCCRYQDCGFKADWEQWQVAGVKVASLKPTGNDAKPRVSKKKKTIIKIIVMGGCAPAPLLPVSLKASEMSAFGPPQGCAS